MSRRTDHVLDVRPIPCPVGTVVDATCACGTWGAALLVVEAGEPVERAETFLRDAHAGHLVKARA